MIPVDPESFIWGVLFGTVMLWLGYVLEHRKRPS